MTKYRILTEDNNRKAIAALVSSRFGGFTMFPAIGYWKGQQENSLVIEILADSLPEVEEAVRGIVTAIKRVNSQESVLLEITEVRAEFL